MFKSNFCIFTSGRQSPIDTISENSYGKIRQTLRFNRYGEVAEWLKAPLSKSGILSKTGSWVRIPPSPPHFPVGGGRPSCRTPPAVRLRVPCALRFARRRQAVKIACGFAERCPSWLKEHDWKSCVLSKAAPRVRIPLSPPHFFSSPPLPFVSGSYIPGTPFCVFCPQREPFSSHWERFQCPILSLRENTDRKPSMKSSSRNMSPVPWPMRSVPAGSPMQSCFRGRGERAKPRWRGFWPRP